MRLHVLCEDRLALTDGEMARIDQIAEYITIIGGLPSRQMPSELLSFNGGSAANKLSKRWIEQESAQSISRSNAKYGIVLTKFLGHAQESSFIKAHPNTAIIKTPADVRGALCKIVELAGGPLEVAPKVSREKPVQVNELVEFFEFNQDELGYLSRVNAPWRIHSVEDLVGMRERPLTLDLMKVIGVPRALTVIPNIIAKIKAGFKKYDGSEWGR